MNTQYEKVCEYYKSYPNICQQYGIVDFEELGGFCQGLARYLGCNESTAVDIWYARQRSWFVSEMVQALIDLETAPKEEFRPNLFSGEFEWDASTNKFVSEKQND